MSRISRWPLAAELGRLPASSIPTSDVYQLVLQFSPWRDRSFDELVYLEDRLIALLGSDAVDGHDLGSGEANIFMNVENPSLALRASLPLIMEFGLLSALSAGYRAPGAASYRRVWPKGDAAEFRVK